MHFQITKFSGDRRSEMLKLAVEISALVTLSVTELYLEAVFHKKFLRKILKCRRYDFFLFQYNSSKSGRDSILDGANLYVAIIEWSIFSPYKIDNSCKTIHRFLSGIIRSIVI